MNRKNTILIAVIINAGLLAVLLIAAMTMQDDLPVESQIVKESSIELQLPKFEDVPAYQELTQLTLLDPPKQLEEPLVMHKLPPQMVLEPAPAFAPEPPLAAAPIQTPVQTADPALPPFPMNEIVVKKGDSLEKLAKNNHTSVDEIIKLNHLPSTFLKIGQVLKIPTEKNLPKINEKKPLAPSPEYYTMKVGENPWAIAQRHHMKVEDLLKLNGLNEEKARKLKPGDRLRIR